MRDDTSLVGKSVKLKLLTGTEVSGTVLFNGRDEIWLKREDGVQEVYMKRQVISVEVMS